MTTTHYPLKARAAAWAVHCLTMSGLVWASLATLAAIHQEITWMWVWLLVALVVDGVDGTLARRTRVAEIIPWFDGVIVDIVVDYLTWTFIPALFMYLYLPMGAGPVKALMLILILSSSMFCYANKNWKSTDYYFVGFPAAWNIVALMFYVLGTPAWVNVPVTIILAILTLVPTHYVHPARVKRFRALNIASAGVWLVASSWLVAIHPSRPLPLVAGVVIAGGWFMLVGVLRSIRGVDEAARA
ncbi:CDP-alcohol phosphatidyltransferase family protein [Actinomyces bowdenii]|uniref:CDP-alcohol phosphatidyltransferase family protein n=1 Tax=Actinomyces bowdenii TaxID=131109 RepID=UPI001ABD2649|nr:CDP-alcohol phosphatidyltransferase family protein [Actinomyces bowdenii]